MEPDEPIELTEAERNAIADSARHSGLEGRLLHRGFTPGQVIEVTDLIEDKTRPAAIAQVAELVSRIMHAVGYDTAAGCALRRALGYSGGLSRRRAARDILIPEQQLQVIQLEIERHVGRSLAFGPPASCPPSPGVTGPPGEVAAHR